MRKRTKAIALGPFLALAGWAMVTESGVAAEARRPVGPGGDPAWRLDALWDDGRAEYCAYEVAWPRYGTLWTGSATLVLVKEPWAPELDVKADRPRDGGFEVLKLNHLRDVRTGIYAYHQMASVFLDRRRGHLVKLATSSTEACGVTTATLRDGRLDTRSYFDGQGDASRPYPGGLPEDGLPALLRELVRGEAPAAIEVFPSLLDGRLPELAPATWRLTRRPAGAVAVPAGTFAAVELALERGERWRRYRFAAEPPHPLLTLEADDGTRYRLARCERLAYWQLHRPGDEEWLPASLR